jgi:UDP-3-O-[3-hydroxymyristoyl] glucosamine N-acyltransferase
MRLSKPISLSQLLDVKQASNITYEVVGEPNAVIKGLDDYQVVLPQELTWVDYAPFYSCVFKTDAIAIIIDSLPKKLPQGKTLIVTPDPKALFDLLAEAHYDSQFPPRSRWERIWNPKDIHIGKNCKIHKSVIIGKHVHIGDNVTIEPYVTISDNVIIGDNVIIHNHCAIGGRPFAHVKQSDGTYEPRKSWGNTIILDYVELAPMTNIDRGITGSTIIGSGTKTCAICQIGHDTWIGSNCYICSGVTIAGYVRIKNNCEFWGQSGVSSSIHVAEGTCVNGCSVILKDVTEPNQTLAGFPAEPSRDYWKRAAILRKIASDYESK